MKIETLDPRDCTRWKYADRSSFEFGDTNALAEDIRANGQINPVFVRPLVDSPKFKYEVIAGCKGGCKSLTQVGYLFYVLQNFQRAVKFQTTSWSII